MMSRIHLPILAILLFIRGYDFNSSPATSQDGTINFGQSSSGMPSMSTMSLMPGMSGGSMGGMSSMPSMSGGSMGGMSSMPSMSGGSMSGGSMGGMSLMPSMIAGSLGGPLMQSGFSQMANSLPPPPPPPSTVPGSSMKGTSSEMSGSGMPGPMPGSSM